MEKEKISNIFASYIRKNLSPTEKERKMIADRYEEICGLLVGNEIFQMGSYARFTSVTPVSDLDIIWVIPRSIIDQKLQSFGLSEKAIDPNKLKLSDILVDLANKIEKEYVRIGQKVNARPQTHSVGVYFGSEDEFSIDIVPAVKSGDKNEYDQDIYFVPEDKDEKIIWIKSDPRGSTQEAQELNDKNDSFRKSAKFVKKWKNNCKEKNEIFPLKSLHLEVICKEIIKNNPDISVYETLVELYSNLDLYLSEPKFPDRANPQIFIDDYVKGLSEAKIEVVTKMRDQALSSLEAMEGSDNETGVSSLIAEILSGEETFSHKINSVFRYAVSSILVPPSWQKPLLWPKVSPVKIGVRCFLNGVKEVFPKNILFPNKDLKFVAEFTGSYDEIYWQVVNTGEEAMSIGEYALRGDYFKAKDSDSNPSGNPLINWERTAYHGSHWISCFAVKNDKCVAVSDPYYVNIFNSGYLRYKKPRKR